MKKSILLFFIFSVIAPLAIAQKKDKSTFVEYEPGFYVNSILKDVTAVKKEQNPVEKEKYFMMDQSNLDLPNKVNLYKREWAEPVISQGNAGTCWAYSTISFYESEVKRITGKEVKLSEIFVAYWEYVEKAKRFVEERGNSVFDEGSEGNAVTRIIKDYGLVPYSEYTGLINGRKFHSHADLMKEMRGYLKSVKRDNAWNEDEVIATIKDILNHHLGVPPHTFTVDGKNYNPKSFASEYLKIKPEDYVEILSYKQEPYWKQVEYKVPDNWWHSKEYYNVPLDDFMNALNKAIRKGYTMSIGGDVSESGFVRSTQCAMIPSYDIPAQYIDEDARQFRFSNQTTTDDHGMHLVGYLQKDGVYWYLIKDSSSGSRNNDPNAPEFGYYFFRQDYVKLKMMGFTVHKDAVKDLLKKFN